MSDEITVGPAGHCRGGALAISRYSSGAKGPALSIIAADGSLEAVASVNLVDHPLPDNEVWLKTWGGLEGVPEALEEAGAVKLTGRRQRVSFEEVVHAELLVPAPSLEELGWGEGPW